MSEKDNLSLINKKIIRLLRQRNDLSKSQIATHLKLPWSTVATNINYLIDHKYIKSLDGKSTYGAGISLNCAFEYYCGISVGSSNIKVVICDFSFQISEKRFFGTSKRFSVFSSVITETLGFDIMNPDVCEWCRKTPNTTEKIRSLLRNITLEISKLCPSINIKGIGYTFPGHINYEKQVIVNSFSNKTTSGFVNVSIDALLGASITHELLDKDISFYIDHNIKSSTIAEKEYLQNTNSFYNDENLLVLYYGKGISLGMVFNNLLYRGNDNRASELGKTRVYVEMIKGDGAYKSLEGAIREDVFPDYDSPFFSTDASNLCAFLAESTKTKHRILLINILSQAIYNITCILGINKIIFSGKLHMIFKEIEWELLDKLESMGVTNISLIKSGYKEYSAAMGAAISCYYRNNSCDFDWND